MIQFIYKGRGVYMAYIKFKELTKYFDFKTEVDLDKLPEYAKEYAETEFEKYRIIQDRLFRSDFDKFDGNEDLPSLDFKE